MPDELRHLWSLAAEEQFYLVWPMMLCFILRGRVRLALLVVGAGAVLMTARQFQLYVDGASWERMGFGIDTRNVSILVGCTLALLLALPGRPRLERAAMARATGGGLRRSHSSSSISADSCSPARSSCSRSGAPLILGVLDGRSPVARVLSLGAVVFVGRISYSLYLWHFPVFVLLERQQAWGEPAAVPALVDHRRARDRLLLPRRASVPATQARERRASERTADRRESASDARTPVGGLRAARRPASRATRPTPRGTRRTSRRA